MKRANLLLCSVAAVAMAALTGGFLLAFADRAAASHGSHGARSANVNSEIAAARAATARYHDLNAALQDGFVNTGLACVEGQGFHYINRARIGTLDVRSPQVLVYAPDGRLVALEWLMPSSLVGGVPPVLFGETFHGPNAGGSFFLHVWAWQANPNGMFADTHPLIHCGGATP